MFTTLAALFFVGSIAGILFITVRHLPTVSSLRPEELAHIRHQQLKTEILLTRFERFFALPIQQWVRGIVPLASQFAKKFHRLLNILKALEHHYEKTSLQKQRTETHTTTVSENIVLLLSEAKELHAKELFDDAERKYIAAIALDPKSIPAYEGLGELYFQQKDYESARETYTHIVRLNERNVAAHSRLGAIASASGNLSEAEKDYTKALELGNDLVTSHLDLGVVHAAMSKHEEALANFMKARELEPKNPRVLDALLATAIILGKRVLAEEAFAALAETNPENQKLAEIEEKIHALPEAEEVGKKVVRRKKKSEDPLSAI